MYKLYNYSLLNNFFQENFFYMKEKYKNPEIMLQSKEMLLAQCKVESKSISFAFLPQIWMIKKNKIGSINNKSSHD
jgi:hypothetical protein